MAGVEIYTFIDESGEEFGSYHTADIRNARDYARQNGLAVVANTYEWVDSEVVAEDDYRPTKPEETEA